MTNIILRAPYCNYSIIYPKSLFYSFSPLIPSTLTVDLIEPLRNPLKDAPNPFLIIKAPILRLKGYSGKIRSSWASSRQTSTSLLMQGFLGFRIWVLGVIGFRVEGLGFRV